jgi:cell division septation protein DedD
MSDRPRWVTVVLIAVLIVGLVAVARGRAHHRGDEVGAADGSVETAAPAASE